MSLAIIISQIKSYAGILYPPLKKRFLDQPKVYVHIHKPGGDSKMNLGLSMNNQTKTEVINGKSIEYIEGESALRFFRIERPFQMRLYNNSAHHAYKLRLLKPDPSSDCKLNPLIDYLKPLKQNEADSFTLTFASIHETTGFKSVEIFNTPSDYFYKNKVFIEYCNVRGTKFYTEFDLNRKEEDRNIFHRSNPLGKEN